MVACGMAKRVSAGFQLRHCVAIPTVPVSIAYDLGERVRITTFRVAGRWHGEGNLGTVVAINLPVYKTYGEPRPYQVLLDGCPNKLFRFGNRDLELVGHTSP